MTDAPTPPSELFDVAGRRVVVTGGTSGIGRMIAGGFAAGGAHVVVTSRKAGAVDDAVASLDPVARAAGGSVSGTTSNLSTEQGCRDLAEWVGGWAAGLAAAPAVDVLVNNAGATWGAPLADHDAAAWDRVLDLNVQGVFHTTRFLLGLLRAGASADAPARVINIGSINGMVPPPMETYSYTASKAAVHQLTRHLATQLAPEVTVNAVAPGPFPSKMMKATLDAFGEHIVAGVPMKRLGRADDAAGICLFLASRAGSYLTGAVIPLDGGMTAGGAG
jgi:NAD(P)-dependent dehydrogenase (short-subunit alcohol dehydrogenase family)